MPKAHIPVKWLSHAKEVYVGTADHHRPGGKNSEQEPLPVIYRVVRRSIDKHGQPLLIDQISVETYWTNLGQSAAGIIALYHDHGTSEQYHSELKSDLNLERFPSQSFAVNTLILQLGAYAYNLLRSLDELARSVREEQAESWPERIKAVKRRRVGSIIRDLIHVACKWVRHSGREVMKLASQWPWSRVLLAMDARLSAT
ncbi:MAG: transposase [Verrucomicrobiaceae bacterium]|nr:transposase [Verrucomicrobiaceae bacterium]